MITINLDKAKEIKKEKLREERNPLLTQLDIQFQRALESNSDTTEIVKEKQRLRDITKLVDKCKTISALDKVQI